ncbi:MAG: 50S ribosomal protein L1 [Chloroflexota bacterium]|nr:50S ribosomal protein L1 [Dehalococcoidia bacterium]MDW8252335.1 50S ribosomal protein L1 [Chloroflexota bacterium]
MRKRGKHYLAALEKIDPAKRYDPREAIALAKAIRFAKFDETVELHLRMGLDPRHADQQVRGVALLPHGLGKRVRVLVFTGDPEGIRNAQEAGADYVGSDDLIRRIEEGWLDFDATIATPEVMGKVSRLGRILGRRGLMPNPRSGTVVQPADVGRAIRDARKGRVEFRLDRTANIHVPIGKVSFDDAALVDNLATIIDAIVKAKPSGAKGQYVKSATLTTTMGPGIPLDLSSTLALKAA